MERLRPMSLAPQPPPPPPPPFIAPASPAFQVDPGATLFFSFFANTPVCELN